MRGAGDLPYIYWWGSGCTVTGTHAATLNGASSVRSQVLYTSTGRSSIQTIKWRHRSGGHGALFDCSSGRGRRVLLGRRRWRRPDRFLICSWPDVMTVVCVGISLYRRARRIIVSRGRRGRVHRSRAHIGGRRRLIVAVVVIKLVCRILMDDVVPSRGKWTG